VAYKDKIDEVMDYYSNEGLHARILRALQLALPEYFLLKIFSPRCLDYELDGFNVYILFWRD
jgi:hypothetical protein